MSGVLRGLTQNRAHTDPSAADRRLRGRTYAIPFDAVWTASLDVARGRIRGWTVVETDDERGVIRAESVTLLWRFVDDVRISIGLDENGQTRVDVESASRVGKGDLGRNPRTIGTFLRRLDKELAVRPGHVLDPTRAAGSQDLS